MFSVNPERDKVKAQLRDLEAVFAAEESGGSASVSSKASLWKMREQAALASGEKTVCLHHPLLLCVFSLQEPLYNALMRFFIILLIKTRWADLILKKGCADRARLCDYPHYYLHLTSCVSPLHHSSHRRKVFFSLS